MRRNLLFLLLLPLLVLTGCTAKAKLERHVKRADAYFEKGEHEKARIEYLNAFQIDKNDPHVAARLGESFLREGEVVRAFQLFSHALSLQPTNNDVRIKLASVLLIGGEAGKAREHALEVLKRSPLDPDALLIFANASVRTNEIAEARARFESLAASSPANAPVFLGLGTIAQRSGAPELAETAFKRAVELDPKSAKNNLALGSFYFLRGDTNKAEIHLKSAMEFSSLKSVERLGYAEFLQKTGRGEAAERTLNEATAKHPEFLAAWNMLTQLAFTQNNTNKASEYIAKALAREPQNRDALLNKARLKLVSRDFKNAAAELERLSNEHPRDSQIHYQLAVAQVASEDPLKALVSLDKAIGSNTNNLDAYLLRARLQISRGDWNNAISDLNQLIRRHPGAPQAYYLLASAHRARGNLDEAIAVYKAITQNFPKDPQALQMIGAVYRQQKKVPQARQAFEQALKVNPDYLAAIDSLVDLDIAAEQHEAALARIQGYVEKYPKSPLPPLLQGKVLFQQQKNAEAEAAVKKAIELDPEFAQAHRALADFYVRSQQTDKAIAKFEAILEDNKKDNKKDMASLIQLGMLYESKNNYARAQQLYEAVLKSNPNSIIALNNLAYILSERLGNVDRGLQYARRARDVAPYDASSADTLGWILWKKGEYAEALAALEQSAERLPDQSEVQYHLGMAHYMVGDVAQARIALTKAVQSTNEFIGKNMAASALSVLQIDPEKAGPETIQLLQKQLTENARDVFAAVQLARLYQRNAEWAKAREVCEKALAGNPKSPLLLSELARLYAGPLKQPDRALDLAKQVWAAYPTPALAEVLGPIAFMAGDYKWANGRLLEASRSKDDAELQYYKGLTAYALGNLSAARDELTRLDQSKNLSSEKLTLVKAAVQILKLHTGEATSQQAQSSIEAARRLDPLFPPALVAPGLIAEQKKDYPAAQKAYEAALQDRPMLLIAQRQLAILLAEKLADDGRAQQLATALRQDLPGDIGLSRALGKIAYRRGEYREAQRLLSSVAAQRANDGDVLYYLGMAQYHLKDKSAKASLVKAIALEPNATLTADAKKALAELK